MLRADGDEVVGVAVRPVVAAESGIGQAHRGTSHDDDRQQHEIGQGEATERARRQFGNAHRRQCTDGPRGGTQRVLGYPFPECAAGSSFRSSRCCWLPVSPRPACCCGWNGLPTTTSLRPDPGRQRRHRSNRRTTTMPPSTTTTTIGRRGSGQPVTFAFAGDIHFEGVTRATSSRPIPSGVLAPIAPVLGGRRPDGREPRNRDHRRRHAGEQGVHVPRAAVGADRARGRRNRRREHGEQPRHGLRARRARGLADGEGEQRLPDRRDRPQRDRGVHAVPDGHQGAADRGHRRDAGARRQPDHRVDGDRRARRARVGEGRAPPRRRRARARATSDTVVVFLHWGDREADVPERTAAGTRARARRRGCRHRRRQPRAPAARRAAGSTARSSATASATSRSTRRAAPARTRAC